MEKKVISFLGGLNKDDNGLNFPEGDYKSANNIIIETDEEGNGIAIKKIKSTKELSSSLSPSLSQSEYVQSCKDVDDTIYVLAKGKNSSGTVLASIHKIKLGATSDDAIELTEIIDHYDYQGCSIVPDMVIVGDRLIWNFMGDGVPLMIRISQDERYPPNLKNLTPTYNELTLIKAPPILQLQVTEIAGDSYSIFSDHVYQFAARYVYDDGEVSVLGPISALTSGVDLVDSIKLDLNTNEVIPTKAIDKGKIEYYVREGNNGFWFLIDAVNLNEPNTSLTYNGIKSVALPSVVSSKQFDFVPYATKNIEAVNNLLFLGNNEESLPLGGVPSLITTTDLDFSPYSAEVTSINVLDGGLYHPSAPVLVTVGGSATAAAVKSPVGGSGYTSTPTVTSTNGFYNNNASLTAVVTNGAVSSITINTGGLFGPNVTPAITISGGGGSGAYAYPVLTTYSSGYSVITSVVLLQRIDSITITNSGSGYRSTPSVTISSSPYGTATASAEIDDPGYDGSNYAYYKTTNSAFLGYEINPSDPYSKGFTTDMEDETKPFANGSTYEIGYVLFDEYMRTRGVESITQFTTPTFGFNKYNININKQQSFPSWVKYFQLAVTKNLTKDFIYEGYASTCYFVAEVSNEVELSSISELDYTKSGATILLNELHDSETSEDRKTEINKELRTFGYYSTNNGQRRARRRGQEKTPIQIVYDKTRATENKKSIVANPVPFLPKTGLKASDIRDKIKYFAVDLAGMFEAERYYTFQPGDEIIGNFDSDNESKSDHKILKILAQDGSTILCDPSPLVNVTNLNSVERSLYFEIYSPSDVNKSSIFYGNRDVYPISELEASSGSKLINLEGDCYYNSISLPSYGHPKLTEEANTYTSLTSDDKVRLTISAATDIANVGTSKFTTRYTPKADIATDLWELDLGSGEVLINKDGLYTIEYSGFFEMYFEKTQSSGGGVTRLADTIQIGLSISGESVRYADLQNFETSTIIAQHFKSTCSVFLYAGDSVSIVHQKSDEFLNMDAGMYNYNLNSSYHIDGYQYGFVISKDAISTSPFAKKYRRGEKTFMIGVTPYTPPNKDFIIKSLSRSGKLQTNWEKDYGKPYTKYTAPPKSDFIKNRVRYSGRYIDGGILSSLSAFSFDDYTDLPVEISSINALKRTSDQQSNGTVVLAMGGKDTFSLYIDRAMVSTADGQDLTTQSNRVISQIYPLKGGFGCQDKNSIVRKEGKVFFYDRTEKVYVRYASEGLEPIERKMQNYFKDKNSVNAVYYDPFHDMIFINFSDTKTLAYSDKLKRYIAEFDMSFDGSYYVDNKAYIMTTRPDENNSYYKRIILHETQTGTEYGNLLGVPTVAKIKLTSNSILPVNVGHIQIKTSNWLDWTSHIED